MPNEGSAEEKVLRAALSGGGECPPVEQLEQLLGGAAPAHPDLAPHVEACPHCQTELSLLREFQSGAVRESEAKPVRLITERLRARSAAILPAPSSVDDPWWKSLWTARWLSPVALAAAAVLIFIAVGVQWRQTAPSLRAPAASEQEVLRSNTLVVLSPSGDIQQPPVELRWQPAPGAVKYRVRLLEVDHTELWSTETTADHTDLPSQTQGQIVPHKTLLWEVSAIDGSGRIVAESNSVRFRLLQNVYTR